MVLVVDLDTVDSV